MCMRQIRRVEEWPEAMAPSPITGSVQCTVFVDRHGYEFVEGLQVCEDDAETPIFMRTRHHPSRYPNLTEREPPPFAEDLFTDGPFLLPKKMGPGRRAGFAHDPLAVESLHIEFAGLRNPTDVSRFACKYGLLGYAYQLEADEDNPGLALPSPPYGESFEFWMHHVGTVRLHRALWPMILAEENVKLDRYVDRDTSKESQNFTDAAYEEFANEFTLPTTSEYFEGSYSSGLNFQVPPMDDRPASQLAYDCLASDLNDQLRAATEVYVEPPDPNVYIVVTDLLGAIYWHLSREVTGSSSMVKFCHQCQGLIRDARADAKYCSNACRQKAYQAKKKSEDKS